MKFLSRPSFLPTSTIPSDPATPAPILPHSSRSQHLLFLRLPPFPFLTVHSAPYPHVLPIHRLLHQIPYLLILLPHSLLFRDPILDRPHPTPHSLSATVRTTVPINCFVVLHESTNHFRRKTASSPARAAPCSTPRLRRLGNPYHFPNSNPSDYPAILVTPSFR